jgi:hypothetical protein
MYNKNIIELFCKIFHLLHGVTAHPVLTCPYQFHQFPALFISSGAKKRMAGAQKISRLEVPPQFRYFLVPFSQDGEKINQKSVGTV